MGERSLGLPPARGINGPRRRDKLAAGAHLHLSAEPAIAAGKHAAPLPAAEIRAGRGARGPRENVGLPAARAS